MDLMRLLPIDFLHNSEELRKLIIENPDMPLCFITNDEDCIGDNVNTIMTNAYCHIEDVFSAELPIDQYGDFRKFYDDKIEFEEDLDEYFRDNNIDNCNTFSDDVYDSWFNSKLMELQPYWKKVIVIRLSNM